MQQFQTKSPPGFTLIELLIYSGLVTVLTGTFLTTSYYLITSDDRDRERQAVYENARVLGQKLEWVMYGAASNQVSPSSGAAQNLQVQRSCPDYKGIDLVGTAIRLGQNSDGDCDLDSSDQYYNVTNSHVQASALQFERVTYNGQPAIRMTATLQGQYQTYPIDKTVYIK